MESDLLSVRTNTAAMKAATAVTMAQRSIETSMERLPTGKRLNSAADDAAGVAISSRLNASLRGTNQSIRNALDAQALLDTAEGAMQETEALLQRIRELAVQAANGTNSAQDRAALDSEVQSLLAEIDRISQTTTWAGQKLLDGSFANKNMQVGGGTMAADQLTTSITGASAANLGVGSFDLTSPGISIDSSITTPGISIDSSITTPQKIGSGFQVNSYFTGDQTQPDITALENGGFVITYVSGKDSTPRPPPNNNIWQSSLGIYGQIYDASMSKVGGEFSINTTTADAQNYPSISSLTGGGFVVTWDSYHQDGSFGTIISQVFDSTGQKIGPEIQSNTYTSQNQTLPVVASNGNGFVNVWQSQMQDGSAYSIYGQRHDNSGNKVGAEFKVNSYSTDRQINPAITALGNGGFVVTWASEGQDGSGWGHYGQIYDGNGSKVGSEFRVTATTSGNQGIIDNGISNGPSVTSLDSGGFVAIWTSQFQDGSGHGMYGQIFEADGTKVGGEILLNTTTAGDQAYGDVTALKDGGFLVAWNDPDNTYGGYGNDVFAQRFNSEGAKIGSEFQVSLATHVQQQDQMFVSTATLNTGEVVMSWQASNAQDWNGEGVFAQIFDVGVSVSSSTSDIASIDNALDITSIDNALQTLAVQRSALGSLSNRLDHIVANNTNVFVNISASIGRIKDADFAAETTNLAKQQILQQASIAMLAQANASKQNILTLLQG